MIDKLIQKIQKTGAPVVVGLDPTMKFVPDHIRKAAFDEMGETLEGAAEAVWQFNKAIVDSTCDLIPAVKPQIAMYEQFGIPGLAAFKRTVDYCREKGLVVIGDVKRGDIGSTSAAYAAAHLGRVQVGGSLCAGFEEDFVTVNPYLGSDGTPAESTTYRLAKHDREKWSDIITAGHEGDQPYYTNSSHLPVDFTTDIFDALDIQDELQTLYTSGTVFHAFLGEKLPDWKAAANLVRTIAENYKLPYYTMSPTYSVCSEHGYLTGEQKACPKCGRATEIYSRITGYYRPVQNWNDGKLQEYQNRTEYRMGSRIGTISRIGAIKQADQTPAAAGKSDTYLFTTKTCPNCSLAKKYLQNVDYTVVDAEENMELAVKYGVRQAPTLVIVAGQSQQKYVNLSNIRKYAELLQQNKVV